MMPVTLVDDEGDVNAQSIVAAYHFHASMTAGEGEMTEIMRGWGTVGVISKSTLEGLAGRDSCTRFSSTVWLVGIRFVSCLMRTLRSLIALLSSSCYKVLSIGFRGLT